VATTAGCYDLSSLNGDAAPADGGLGSDGSTAPCPHLFCEDFEGPPSKAWTLSSIHGTSLVDGTRPHGGGQSLHVTTEALTPPDGGPTETAEAYLDATGPFTGPPYDPVWVRFWIYMPSTNGAQPATLAILRDSDPVIQIGYGGDQYAGYDSLDQGTALSGVGVIFDGWVCMEWSISASTPQEYDVYLGGNLILARMDPTMNTPPAPYQDLYFGLLRDFIDTPVPAGEAWFDDLAVDKVRIGCR
jgi:hypothetical protein